MTWATSAREERSGIYQSLARYRRKRRGCLWLGVGVGGGVRKRRLVFLNPAQIFCDKLQQERSVVVS